ncbi:glycosyltransferase family 4 protein [Photobacterium leiognathi]|uniref:glycosyltransferase family 4 protein n=1 Tax=Photobacterium leiognathi TaxID=553611 RepID=UPI0029829319|nr:glycosyltransferase family 4 protein [Photobacterium leiognathi]
MNQRVVVVTGHSKLDSGGVGTHIRLLIDSLTENGVFHGAVLGSSIFGKAFHYSVKKFAIISKQEEMYHSIYPIANIYFIQKKLDRKLSNLFQIDKSMVILHTHDRSSTIAAHNLKKKYNIKIIQTLHAPFYQQYEIHPIISKSLVPLYIRGLDKETVNFADSYIAVDDLQRDLILRDFKEELADKEVFVISNAVEKSLLTLKKPRKIEGRYFVIARHLHEKNGVEYGIRAFSEILKLNGNKGVKLYILGQGPLEQKLKILTRQLEIEDDVKFLGPQPRKICLDIINKSMGSIVPSIPVGDYIEATSLTMLESMAMNVPLIASNIGGLKQVLSGRDAAFLIPAKDINGIRVAMQSIIDDEDKVRELTLNAKNLVKNNYTTDSWIKRIFDVYNK